MKETKKQEEVTQCELVTVLLPLIDLSEKFVTIEKSVYQLILNLHKAGLFTRNCLAEDRLIQPYVPTCISFSQELSAQNQLRAISILKATYRDLGKNPDDMVFVFKPHWNVGKSINKLGQEVSYPFFNSALMIFSDVEFFKNTAAEILNGELYDDFAIDYEYIISYSDQFSQQA